ncbi:unnamed protein product [Acanthoscelides obtectus]|uniref:Uncharacterized protein n=1 Tax=Acanthoscelides obtectus TaxID=200917 RepID=A0A9P0KW47_ACAOB|nr:unnamed protein product [Acanthoscelides obtectus]CAK1625563.1 hypothetical protein AOBTE_LOCUS3230 [Acanthoscelides obtectus]
MNLALIDAKFRKFCLGGKFPIISTALALFSNKSSKNQSPSLDVSLISQSPLRCAATSNVSKFLFRSTSSLAMTNSMALAAPFSRARKVATPAFAFDSRFVFLRPPPTLPLVADAPVTVAWCPPPNAAPASTSPPTVQSIRGSYTNASRRMPEDV